MLCFDKTIASQVVIRNDFVILLVDNFLTMHYDSKKQSATMCMDNQFQIDAVSFKFFISTFK